MARLVWSASSCTSRRLPPTCETLRAARVMKVRRPECDEHPSILSAVYRRWNHKRTVVGDNPPPRSEKSTACSGRGASPRAVCKAVSASCKSGCSGIVRPPVVPCSYGRRDVIGKVAQSLAQCHHPQACALATPLQQGVELRTQA